MALCRSLRSRSRSTLLALALLAAITVHPADSDTAFMWQNVPWFVRESTTPEGPGNNYWNASSVRLPLGADGPLELTVHHRKGRWECAEVYTDKVARYGTYVFHVEGRPDIWDKNLVLGMFTYPTNGADGTYEIDIELTRWGEASGPWDGFTVWRNPTPPWSRSFGSPLDGSYTTHYFNWQAKAIALGSLHGFQTNLTQPSMTFARSVMGPADGPRPDLKVPARLHINLWRFNGATDMAGSLTVRIHRVIFPPSFPRPVARKSPARRGRLHRR